MTPILVQLLLAAALGASAKPGVVDASFEVRLPAGWQMERRGGGAVFTGPSAEGIPALISVRYVRPDDPQDRTPKEYMDRLTRPSSIPLKGWKDGPVRRITAAGREALSVERDTTQTAAPRTLEARTVALREEHVAVSAAKGFYLLVYTAPRSIDKAQRAVFRDFVEKGFKPKL